MLDGEYVGCQPVEHCVSLCLSVCSAGQICGFAYLILRIFLVEMERFSRTLGMYACTRSQLDLKFANGTLIQMHIHQIKEKHTRPKVNDPNTAVFKTRIQF